MSEILFERIRMFIVNQIGVDELEVTRVARLQNDLGIYGDDAVDFLLAFSKEFDVDIAGFRAADYFKGEGIDFLGLGAPQKPFTVEHLEKAALTGCLNDEIMS